MMPGSLSDEARFDSGLFYVVTAIIAIYTHYMLAPLIIAQGLTLLLRRPTRFLGYFGDMCVVTLAFAPFFPTFVRQLLVDTTDKPDHDLPDASLMMRFVRGAIRSFGVVCQHLLPVNEGRQWIALRVGLLTGLLACIACWRRSIRRKTLELWITTGILVSLFALVFAFVQISARHTCSTFLPSLLSAVAALQLPTSATARQRLSLIGLATFLLLSGICFTQRYSPLAKDGDAQRVARFLEESERQGQTILVFDPSVEMVLSHYYAGRNQMVAVPTAEDFEKFSINELVLTDESQLLGALAPETNEFWLVNDEGILLEIRDFDESFRILEQFVATRCIVIRDERFYGSRVRLLALRRELAPAE